jgi:malate dehydrogenase (oxaloacetate-decarboxylating)
MNFAEASIRSHKKHGGKFAVRSKMPLTNKAELSLAYTPGVGAVSSAVAKNPKLAYELTAKQNMVAVVSDGSAVLGLGNIGPLGAMPVMEGKAVLFKTFANIDAVPIVLSTQDPEEIIKIVEGIAPTFGGINLEDIAAPNCFYIERQLRQKLRIPVFHDDQHGTAMVVLAALLNALKVVKKNLTSAKIVVNGAGAAGSSVVRILAAAGAKNLLVLDSEGLIYAGRPKLNSDKQELARLTNPKKERGDLSLAAKKSDVLIGVSKANVISQDMVASMNKDAIVFALANPVPEIMPDLAKRAGAKVVATGRSDFPNQINNVLVFPGFFRGLLDGRKSKITPHMYLAAAKALAHLIKKPSPTNIIPSSFDKRVVKAVSQAVRK